MLGPQDYYHGTPFKPLGDGRYQTGGEDARQVLDMNDPQFILVQEGNGWSGGYTWCTSARRWKPREASEEGFCTDGGASGRAAWTCRGTMMIRAPSPTDTALLAAGQRVPEQPRPTR